MSRRPDPPYPVRNAGGKLVREPVIWPPREETPVVLSYTVEITDAQTAYDQSEVMAEKAKRSRKGMPPLLEEQACNAMLKLMLASGNHYLCRAAALIRGEQLGLSRAQVKEGIGA